jgi:hypothetical protein
VDWARHVVTPCLKRAFNQSVAIFKCGAVNSYSWWRWYRGAGSLMSPKGALKRKAFDRICCEAGSHYCIYEKKKSGKLIQWCNLGKLWSALTMLVVRQSVDAMTKRMDDWSAMKITNARRKITKYGTVHIIILSYCFLFHLIFRPLTHNLGGWFDLAIQTNACGLLTLWCEQLAATALILWVNLKSI